jgi:50S ribosomal protein L16 3-hydroxylase
MKSGLARKIDFAEADLVETVGCHIHRFAGRTPNDIKEGWKEFGKVYWNKKPCVIRGFSYAPVVSKDEVLDTLKTISIRNGTETEFKHSCRFFVGDFEYNKTLSPPLPKGSEPSLESYFFGLAERWGGQQIGIQVIDFHSSARVQVWNKFRVFLRGLYSEVGMPIGDVELELFLGDYSKTPAGVHQDQADIFMTVVTGKKFMRVWPDKIFKEQPNKNFVTNYSQYLSSSTLLVGEPGDILYWPSSYWHVAEGNGKLTGALSLALYHQTTIPGGVTDPIEFVRKSKNLPTLPFDQKFPKVIRKWKGKARAEFRDSNKIHKKLEKYWVEKFTAFGFRDPPASINEIDSLQVEDIVRVNKDFPIYCMRNGREIILASDGYSFSTRYHRRLEKIIKMLNSGSAFRVKELITEFKAIKFDYVVWQSVKIKFKNPKQLLSTLVRDCFFQISKK